MRKVKGFTLIELLVVVAIIGVLAAVGIPIFQGFMQESKISASETQHQNISSQVQAELMKCNLGRSCVWVDTNWTGATSCRRCNTNTNNWASWLDAHFQFNGWRNTYRPDFDLKDSRGNAITANKSGWSSCSDKSVLVEGTTDICGVTSLPCIMQIRTNLGDSLPANERYMTTVWDTELSCNY